MKGKKIKHISLKSLRKKAWALQSEYVRRSEKGICYTCGIKKPWKEQQAGHYIHKDCMDFVLMNIHCQCVSCNHYKSGNSGVYAERLIAEYGEEAVALLRKQSQQVKKYTITELEDIINRCKVLLTEMED